MGRRNWRLRRKRRIRRGRKRVGGEGGENVPRHSLLC